MQPLPGKKPTPNAPAVPADYPAFLDHRMRRIHILQDERERLVMAGSPPGLPRRMDARQNPPVSFAAA